MNNCSNCKHFVRFYVKEKNLLKFASTEYGFCKVDKTHRKKCGLNKTDCKYWEQLPDNNEENEKIENEIRKMSKRLKEIVLYLKNKN